MKLTKRMRNLLSSNFFTKLRAWEYWPYHLIYTPIYCYWLILSIRARAFMFFAGANPGIFLGGFFMESKNEILSKVPIDMVPVSAYFPPQSSPEVILSWMDEKSLSFPIIAKPDKGERGFLVELLHSELALIDYLEKNKVELIIQEYIDYPVEVGVLYYRFPDSKEGAISSFTLKRFLSVTGDGKSTLRQLILDYPRAKLQLEVLEKSDPKQMRSIPEKGVEVPLVAIGNHSRGTTFLNGEHLIDQDLLDLFNRISGQIDGIYFGRFDIRCKSIEDLKAGRNFKILEINGVKSEPTHIYEPGFSLWKAYGVLFRQWNTIYRISMMNKARGFQFPSFRVGIRTLKAFLKYRRCASRS